MHYYRKADLVDRNFDEPLLNSKSEKTPTMAGLQSKTGKRQEMSALLEIKDKFNKLCPLYFRPK